MTEDNKQEPRIKVTDRRMFTADGRLREGFEHLEKAGAEASAKATEAKATEPKPAETKADAPRPAERRAPDPDPPAQGPPRSAGAPLDELPGGPGALGTPSFLELVGTLAEPIAIYLGDAKLPDGGSAENLDAARFYIDLLDVLRAKTAGNLTAQEASLLEDVLYQLRMRYVRKRG